MKRALGLVVLLGMLVFAIDASSQPPGKGDKGDKGDKRPPDGGPPEPGNVIPPFVRDELKLTDDQKKRIVELEKETKAKLKEILTEEQWKTFQETMRKGPGGQKGGKGGPGGEGPGKEGPGKERPDRQ